VSDNLSILTGGGGNFNRDSNAFARCASVRKHLLKQRFLALSPSWRVLIAAHHNACNQQNREQAIEHPTHASKFEKFVILIRHRLYPSLLYVMGSRPHQYYLQKIFSQRLIFRLDGCYPAHPSQADAIAVNLCLHATTGKRKFEASKANHSAGQGIRLRNLQQSTFGFGNWCNGKFYHPRACNRFPCNGWSHHRHLPILSRNICRNHRITPPIAKASSQPKAWFANTGFHLRF